MKKLAIQHPYLSGFIVFVTVTFLGTILGFLIPELRNYSGMDAGIFILLAMMASLLSGVMSGLITSLILEKKKNKLSLMSKRI